MWDSIRNNEAFPQTQNGVMLISLLLVYCISERGKLKIVVVGSEQVQKKRYLACRLWYFKPKYYFLVDKQLIGTNKNESYPMCKWGS